MSMKQVGWGVYTINERGKQVWAHPKGSDRLCFFSEKAATKYGRMAFPEHRLWVVAPMGEAQEVEV